MKQKGFTLIELMVIICIIGILAACGKKEVESNVPSVVIVPETAKIESL